MVPLLGVPKDRSQLKFAMASEWMASGNITQFVKAHRDANRFKLVGPPYNALPPSLPLEFLQLPQLGDAARGLIYMHAWGMVHGDLKGVRLRKLHPYPPLIVSLD